MPKHLTHIEPVASLPGDLSPYEDGYPVFNESDGIIYLARTELATPAWVPTGNDVAVLESDSLTFHEGTLITVAGSSYHTIFDLSGGAVDLLGGVLLGTAIGFRLTIDGTVVADLTSLVQGLDNDNTRFSSAVVPPARASASMKLELYNASGSARDCGWRVMTR